MSPTTTRNGDVFGKSDQQAVEEEVVSGEGGDLFADIDESEIVSASPIIRATLQDLLPPEPLENIVDHKFKMMDYSQDIYNEINIMSVEVKSDEGFRLDEEILDIAQDDDLTLGTVPALKEIVLTIKPKDGLYHRAIVVKIKKKAGEVFVHFFDVGGFTWVKFEALKPVNKEIMKFPILGYHMRLQDVQSTSKLTLRSEYLAKMKRMERRTYRLQLGRPVPNPGVFTEKKMAILLRWNSRKSLADDITALRVWEWEQFSHGKCTDNEICEKGSFGKRFRRLSPSELITTFVIQNGVEFSAQASHVEPEDEGSDKPLLRVTLLDLPIYQNYFDVLHAQLQRYATLITPAPFCPAIGECCMFKLVSTSRYVRNIKCPGRWCRAIRRDVDIIYLPDFDDSIPYTAIPSNDYDIRRIYAEFFKVPILVVPILPQKNGIDIPLSKAQEIFTLNTRFSFKITRPKNVANELDGYYAEYSNLPQQ
ncbi:unnamed protein product [Orchesella dallaii]|uniref:Tudor domain-containing protein n=1 Tax=Orchesella dallaii TaxID=48710 RepID=A0ABP1Q6J8_9HEXA